MSLTNLRSKFRTHGKALLALVQTCFTLAFHGVTAACRGLWAFATNRKFLAIVVICLLIICLGVIPLMIKDNFAADKALRYAFQVLAGNWSDEFFITKWKDDAAPDDEKFLLAMSGIVGVVLNNSVIFVVITFIWMTITSDRRVIMNTADAIALKEIFIKEALIEELQNKSPDSMHAQIISIVQEAFRKGDLEWEKKYLPAAVGKEQAERIVRMLHRKDRNTLVA